MSDAVVFENVSLTRNQTPILRDVSFTLAKGTCSAILGPNGSGKTTITRAIAGTMFPTSGKATVLGNTLGQCNIIELRKRIGIVNPSTDSADYHSSGAVVDSDLSAIDAVCTGYFGTIGLYETPTSEQRDHAEHLLKQVERVQQGDARVLLRRVPRRLHQDDPAAARQPAAPMQSGLRWGWCVTDTLFICLSGSLTWFHAFAFFFCGL